MLDRNHLAHRIYKFSPGRVWHPSAFFQALLARDPGFSWSVVASQAQSNIQLHDNLARERRALAVARARLEGWCDSTTLDTDIDQYATWVASHKNWFR